MDLSGWGGDLRQAVRQARRQPRFTALVVLMLALGIGGSTAVFGWMNTLLLHPLAGIPDAGRLTAVETVMPDGSFHTTSYLDYRDYRDQNTVFAGLAGAAMVAADLARPREPQPQRAWGLIVSENYFGVLGVEPAAGRLLQASDARGVESDPYLVLSHAYWQRRFGGAANVIGSVVEVNHRPFTVLGVTPEGFAGTTVGMAPDYYVPLMMEPVLLPLESLDYRAPGFLHLIGRLRPGVTVAAANAALAALGRELAQKYPATNRRVGVRVSAIGEAHYGLQPQLGPVLWFLLAAMGLVLVIACANVTGLLLTRASAREREQAVRAALGAGGGRLLRQSAVDHGLLALAGGAAGVWVAFEASGWLGALLPPTEMPLRVGGGLSGSAVVFAAAVTAAVGLWMIAAPAALARVRLPEGLQANGRSALGGRRHERVRNVLVVAEAMLAFTVLVGAGLLTRSLWSAQNADPGFATQHELVAAVDARGTGMSDAQAADFFEQLRQRAARLPGAEAASFERWLPLGMAGDGSTRPTIEGYTTHPGEGIDIGYNTVGPEYFATLRIPVLDGRGIAAGDSAAAPLVCVVNESMARRYWPGASPIGHRLNSWNRWWTVVGVVRDSRFASLREAPRPFLYFPFPQAAGAGAEMVVRTAGDPLSVATGLRGAARQLQPEAVVFAAESGTQVLEASLFAERIAARLGLALAGLALLLAGAGLYGVMAFSVEQRMREMGLRMALGALPEDVERAVVGRALGLVAIGIAAGAWLAIGLARAMGGLLYATHTFDPVAWGAGVAALLAAGLTASWGPARRATHADPCETLRES